MIPGGQASCPLLWALWEEGPQANALEDENGAWAVVSLLGIGYLLMSCPSPGGLSACRGTFLLG